MAQIADQIAHRESGVPRFVLISGPSSSGKTTFSHRLSIALRVHGLRPVKVSLDDYYLNRDFYGKYNSHGCIYVREVCDVFRPSDNITMYGHRMQDMTMLYQVARV